jgi:hypothetical protein
MTRLDPSLVLHLRGLSYDGIQGYSVLTYARETLGSGIAARDYGSRFFRNSARPSVILEHPQTMSEEAQRRLKASWDNMHAGLIASTLVKLLGKQRRKAPEAVDFVLKPAKERKKTETLRGLSWFRAIARPKRARSQFAPWAKKASGSCRLTKRSRC